MAARTRDRLFPPDPVPYVDVVIVPAIPDAPITPVIDVTLRPAPVRHYVPYDHARKGRKAIAICGDWCAERDHANAPTCPECQRELAKTVAEVFGTGDGA